MSLERGKYFGLDIMLDQDNKPYLIEAHGFAGTHGFLEAYGDDRFHRKMLSAFARYANNKEIHVCASRYLDHLISRKNIFFPAIKKACYFLAAHRYRKFNPQYQWMRDLHLPKKVDHDFATIGKEVGFEYKTVYPGLQIVNETKSVSDDVGLIIGGSFNARTSNDEAKLVNPRYLEELMHRKYAVYKLLEDTCIGPHLPFTVLHGMGVSMPHRNEQIIYKPNHGGGGCGVRKLEHKDIKPDPKSFRHVDDLLGSLRFDEVNEYIRIRGVLSAVIQEPITPKQVDKYPYHCIRAIVFDGEFIDAYFRVSHSFPCNYSKSASALPLEDKDYAIVAPFAEQVAQNIVDKISDIRSDWDFDNYVFLSDFYDKIWWEAHEVTEAALRNNFA